MSDSLTIFGTDYTGVTGIKAKGTGNGTLTYVRPTGTKSITTNGTGIDVASYASVDVAVPTGGGTPNLQSKTATPTEQQQTVSPDSGYDGLSSVTVEAIPSQYIVPSGTKAITGAGTTDVTEYASASVASGGATASATKGSVSNHSVTVTPKVTRTAGWVSAGSSNGTAITVSASELVSGSTTVTENGTVDVTNLESVTVNVPTGGASQTVHSGTSAPTASVGNDGDLYLVLSGDGSATGYPLEFTSSGMSGTSNAGDCIGKSAEDGASTANMYSSGSGSSGSVDYTFDLPSIPADATITGVTCQVKAHEENASRSEMTLQLYAGNTAKGSSTTVNGTQNTIYDLTTGSWTRAEIDSLVLHTTYGYYGGLVAGATLTVNYSCEAQNECRLTVKDGSWALTGDIWQKSGGAWQQVSSVALEDIIGRA